MADSNYSNLPNSDIDQDSPVNESMLLRLRDNPFAAIQGDPNAKADGKAVYVDKNGKTAIVTDDTDISKRLAPNGNGGVMWASGGNGSTNSDVVTSLGPYSSTEDNGRIARILVPRVGTYLLTVYHVFRAGGVGGSGENAHVHGMCTFFNDQIVSQSSLGYDTGGTQEFLVASDAFGIGGIDPGDNSLREVNWTSLVTLTTGDRSNIHLSFVGG